ncbi:glutamate--tRNA ligase family protein [Pelagicoccus sp. SDUM812005]|uniref:glutamate--tRNA ligase n=1 Tax=Pelagicoccus sp. SDUM812005 TaxID=3041257 RepID=UPI002810347B|nr:glutamate--tRNA ligase family protein [Pelagicoccus sp. SDUM812005]MDQ8180445.1 glutamate--tRNA ligase family protein [Pelagicoccus sp. SDUM812005]
MSQVRVRFAPSPTGSTHIGTARTALFNWLYARKTGGKLVLRIEDTDKERNTDAALEELLNGLKWLGINWDEGPEIGGEVGPYFQSQRGDIYKEYLQKLLDAGRAYEKDGAIFFKLEGERYTEYDDYHKAEVEKVRTQPVVIEDVIRGNVTRREERDFVIVRSNGDPSFHFVNVVDDIAMGITHVLRGEDHLPNTSKHVELFNAFGVKPPVYAHMPMILKDPSQGKGKMSKRDRGALIEEYQQRDFLPEAVVNFIALLGWSPKDDQEVLTIDELIERFDIKDLQKAGARFDEKKMSHINFEHMKRLPIERYLPPAVSALSKAGLVDDSTDQAYLKQVLELCQQKINSFEDLPAFSAYFFSDTYAVDEKVEKKLLKRADAADRIQEVIPALESLDAFDAVTLERGIQELADSKELKIFAYFPLLRFAVSGVGGGPDLLPMLETLGRDTVVARLKKLQASLSPSA